MKKLLAVAAAASTLVGVLATAANRHSGYRGTPRTARPDLG